MSIFNVLLLTFLQRFVEKRFRCIFLIIILSVSGSALRFVSLVETKFLCESFIGQYDIPIYDPESTVKSRKEVPNTSHSFIISKILNEMLTKKERERACKDKE